MKKILAVLLITGWGIFTLLGSEISYSQDKPADWTDIKNYALKHNPQLWTARKALETAKMSYYQSLSNFLPQINLNASKSWSENSIGETSEQLSSGISSSLSLFNGGQDLSNTRIKYLEIKIAEENYRRMLADVIFNLQKNFLQLLAAQENVLLTRKILDRRQQNYELIKFKYEAGREDRGSYLRVEADKIQAEYEYNKAIRDLKTYSWQLAQNMGMESYETIFVTGTLLLPEIPSGEKISTLVESIPEMKIAEYEYQKSEIAINQSAGNFYPRIDLSANRSWSGTNFPLETSSWGYGLNLSYPIFSGGKDLIAHKIARNNRETAAENRRKIRQQLLAELMATYNDLISAIENVRVRQNYLTAAEEQSRINTIKYINGLLSYQDWYVPENDLINAQKSLLEAQKNAELSLATWKNLLGTGE